MAASGEPGDVPLDDSAEYVASLEKRLKRMKAPAPTSASRSAARSMLSSIQATREDHMANFLKQGSAASQSCAVVASRDPADDFVYGQGSDALSEGEAADDLACCRCCFPMYKLLFPERITVSGTERRRLVDSDELQLLYEQDGDGGNHSSS